MVSHAGCPWVVGLDRCVGTDGTGLDVRVVRWVCDADGQGWRRWLGACSAREVPLSGESSLFLVLRRVCSLSYVVHCSGVQAAARY